ncbi:family 16 glycosylhydrolase [Kitasatospora sp. NPDC058170]|uniref:glycoside hydrolase family 16 protein n=1 Tax=Kitasatospora sp. NPDC058170 TaxID=3346364 RepID=UPI0036DDD431
MRTSSRTVPRLLLALLGWVALAATALPPGNPLRVALAAGFLLAGPGTAALLARPTIARTAGGPDRIAAASLAVAISAALAALVAVALLAYGAFTAGRAIAILAVLTTLLAVLPHRPRPGRRHGAGPGRSGPGQRGKRQPGPEQPGPEQPGHEQPGQEQPGPGQAGRSRWHPDRLRRGAGGTAAAALLVLAAACSGSTEGSGPRTAVVQPGSESAAARPGGAVPDQPAAAGTWHLAFQDDFTGSTLDRSAWTTCYDWNDNGCTNAGNHEEQWYQPGQVQVGGDQLTLTAQRKAVTGSDGKAYPWVSGMISTGRDNWNAKPRHTFTYGYFAASLKVPANPDGFFPAFWLIPADTRGTPPEVDVAEFPNTSQYVHMNLHWRGADGTDQHVGDNWGPADFSSDYHVFAVDWEPDAVTWYIDGRQWFQVTDPSRIPAVAMEVVINLAVGYLQSPPDGTDSAALGVRWVQVWQH